MSFKKNILANYLGTGVIALAPVVALPYYLNALGDELWGLVSFITTLTVVFSLLDAGLSQALVREFAAVTGDKIEKKSKLAALLFGFERIYWGFAILAGAVLVLLSDPISSNWLELNSLEPSYAILAVLGAAALMVFQLPGSLYRSLLVGIQSQVTLNKIMVLGVLFKHVGGVLLITKIPFLSTYLIWLVFSVALETFVRAAFAWTALSVKRSSSCWDGDLMRKAFRPALTMCTATILGALTIQMDKIILSGMVSIEKFGYYAVASTVSLGVLQLLYPVVTAITPYAFNFSNKPHDLRVFSFKYLRIVSALIFLGGGLFYLFGANLLIFWLKSEKFAAEVYPILSILLIGTALNFLYTVGYINWFVKAQTTKIMQVNLLSFILSVSLIPLLISKFGVIGASMGWLAINASGLLLSIGWMSTKYINKK